MTNSCFRRKLIPLLEALGLDEKEFLIDSIIVKSDRGAYIAMEDFV